MSDAMERAIKKSSEDTSGFEPLRTSPTRLKSGVIFDADRLAVEARFAVDPSYVACIVIDYINHDDRWDHNLVNFYYDNDEDPTTTIDSYRVYEDGRVESTDVGMAHESDDNDTIASVIEGKD